MASSLWGGRFETGSHSLAVEYSQSVSVDARLALVDIEGSLAHASMLHQRGILNAADHDVIAAGLAAIRSEIQAGTFQFKAELEDVHMNIETALTERIGEAGGRLHTGRSRNDQVATDLRLWVREAIDQLDHAISNVLRTLVTDADAHLDVVMAGYTHLQRAQPTRLSHHILAWCEMLGRDQERLRDARRRVNESPLGAAALASTPFPIDRQLTAEILGFSHPMANSMDAVADRDFAIEFVSALALTSVHLSRIGEELVLFSSQEFGFLTMSDAFSTGSSIMPQKKNPDMAELMRGKSGGVVGNLMTLLTLVKGLPLTYNRDLQEDKRPLFDSFDSVFASLRVLEGMAGSWRWNVARLRDSVTAGYLDATEVADWLAQKGMPFREAHHVSGRLVKTASTRGVTLAALGLSEFRKESPLFDESVFVAMEPERSVERRAAYGGPAKAQVQHQINQWKTRLGML